MGGAKDKSEIKLEKGLTVEEQIEKAEASAKKLRSKIKKNMKGKDDTTMQDFTKDTVKVDKISKKCRRTLRGHLAKIYGCQWSGSDLHLASVSQDGRLLVWNALSTLKLRAYQISCSWTMTCGFAHSGNFVACGGLDNICTIYSTTGDSTNPIKELQGHDGYISCCRFVDDRQILTTSGDSECFLWDIESGKNVTAFKGHTSDAMSVAVSSDGSTFVTGGCDNTCILWDLKSGEMANFFEGHTDDVNCVKFFPSGTAFGSGSDDSTCRLFDIRAGSELMKYEESSEVTNLAFSNSGRLLFSSHADPNIRVWDALKGTHVSQLRGHTQQVSCLDISHDGSALASGCWDNSIKIWA